MNNDFGREQRALKGIKAIVDAYRKGSIKITVGNDDFDMNNHTYDIKTIMAYIQNYFSKRKQSVIQSICVCGVYYHSAISLNLWRG